MKNTILPTLLFALVMMSLACNKENRKIKSGTCTGTFTTTYGSDSESGQTTLELKKGEYFCSGNPNRIPAGGSGTYTANENTIIFKDVNAWTADFDRNLILEGSYAYVFDGDRLVMSMQKNGSTYTYDLQKQ